MYAKLINYVDSIYTVSKPRPSHKVAIIMVMTFLCSHLKMAELPIGKRSRA